MSTEQLNRLVRSAERGDVDDVLLLLGARDYDRAFIAGELRRRHAERCTRLADRVAVRPRPGSVR